MKAKYYEQLAEAIKENIFMREGHIANLNNTTVEIITIMLIKDWFIDDLCGILAAENPKFNKEKFLEGCK